jgi:phosphoglycolate phosphatase
VTPATLIFDLDGTLSDNFEGIANCILHALARMQRPAVTRESLAQFVGPPLRDTFAKLLGACAGPEVEQAVTCYRERYATLGWSENTLYPDISGCLAELDARGHRMFVCTSKPRLFAQRIVAHLHLEHHFAAVYGSELDGAFDDKAQLLAHLMHREQLEADACVMIGDRAQDVRAARLNAVTAAGALWGYGSRGELEGAGAALLIEEPAGLLRAWA